MPAPTIYAGCGELLGPDFLLMTGTTESGFGSVFK
jgi:hypothetical protein